MSRDGNKMRRPRGPMGGHGMRGSGEKAKDFKGTMRRLVSYLAKYRLSIIIVLIFAIGSVTFSVIGPKILGKATTEIFNGLVSKVSGNGTGIDFDAIKRILITLILLYVVSAVFSFIQGFIMSGISQKVAYNLRDELVKKYLNLVGLFDKVNSYPKELSGGQQQRIAIARALICNPYVIFADEPTGALDSETTVQIMDILSELNKKGKTIIMVTHDGDLTKYATRVIRIKDGLILEEK